MCGHGGCIHRPALQATTVCQTFHTAGGGSQGQPETDSMSALLPSPRTCLIPQGLIRQPVLLEASATAAYGPSPHTPTNRSSLGTGARAAILCVLLTLQPLVPSRPVPHRDVARPGRSAPQDGCCLGPVPTRQPPGQVTGWVRPVMAKMGHLVRLTSLPVFQGPRAAFLLSMEKVSPRRAALWGGKRVRGCVGAPAPCEAGLPLAVGGSHGHQHGHLQCPDRGRGSQATCWLISKLRPGREASVPRELSEDFLPR